MKIRPITTLTQPGAAGKVELGVVTYLQIEGNYSLDVEQMGRLDMTQIVEPTTVSAFNASRAALGLDALVGRLTYDEDFAAALSQNPREALENVGISLDKEGMEAYMKTNPERFDKVCEALFGLVESDFLHNLTVPSCA